MKILVDNVEIIALSEVKKKVMKNDIHAGLFDEDMKRRLRYIVTHKYEQSFKRLKAEWDSKLAANGVSMVPTDPDAYALLVFSQPNYLDRSARDALV